MSSTLFCAQPRQIKRLVCASMMSITSVPALVLDATLETIAAHTRSVDAVDLIEIEPARDVGVIVNEQIAGAWAELDAAERQLLLDGALHVILEERILIEPWVSRRQRVGRPPRECAVPREVEPALDVGAHGHSRRTRREGGDGHSDRGGLQHSSHGNLDSTFADNGRSRTCRARSDVTSYECKRNARPRRERMSAVSAESASPLRTAPQRGAKYFAEAGVFARCGHADRANGVTRRQGCF